MSKEMLKLIRNNLDWKLKELKNKSYSGTYKRSARFLIKNVKKYGVEKGIEKTREELYRGSGFYARMLEIAISQLTTPRKIYRATYDVEEISKEIQRRIASGRCVRYDYHRYYLKAIEYKLIDDVEIKIKNKFWREN